MIPFEFMKSASEKELRDVAEAFYEKNLANRAAYKTDALDGWCKANIRLNGREYAYREIACALPDEIRALKEYMDSAGATGVLSRDKMEEPVRYVVTSLFKNMADTAKDRFMDWMEGHDIRTCPYCNHNEIIYDSRRKLNTAELDHYYPKSRYPVLAASFFNLVPSCPTCNHSKGTGTLRFNPFDAKLSHEDVVNIRLWRLKAERGRGDADSCLEVEVSGKGGHREDVELLKLNALYGKHTDLAEDLERKLTIFHDRYIHNLAKEFGHMTPAELKELIFGVRLTPESFSQRRLSKFTYDILRDMENA